MEQTAFVRRTAIVAGFVLALLFLALFFIKAVEAFLLVFGGILCAVLLSVLTEGVQRLTRLTRGWAFTLMLMLLLVALGVAVWLLGPAMTREAETLTANLEQSAEQLQRHLEQSTWGRQLLDQGRDVNTFLPGAFFQLSGLFSSALGALSGALIIGFIGLFLAAQPRLYVHGILRVFPLTRRRQVCDLLHELEHVLRWWLLGQLVSMLVLGTQITIGLWLLGVPLALLLGLLAAVLTFIPYLGPIIASVPALLIALSVSPSMAIYVLILTVIVQNVEGYLLTPAIHQRVISLPAGLTIAMQVLMGLLAGPLGIILATPLLAVLFVLVRRLYIEGLLGDSLERPADDFPEPV
ncbi:MAG TPA: AI-2E family transporter [Clostridia bacterium]|nr:AI-2E family transporter [Clostridia bacterium]